MHIGHSYFLSIPVLASRSIALSDNNRKAVKTSQKFKIIILKTSRLVVTFAAVMSTTLSKKEQLKQIIDEENLDSPVNSVEFL